MRTLSKPAFAWMTLVWLASASCGYEVVVGEARSLPDPDALALADTVDGARWSAAVAAIAQPREPGSTHWQAVQDRCASELAELGYEVERHDYGGGVNVLGLLRGDARERVVLSAHYDSVAGFDGVNDDATGLAGVLEAARALAGARYERSLLIACWDDSTRGSYAYALRESRARIPIVAMLSLDGIGLYSEAPGSQIYLPEQFDLLFPEQAAAITENERRGDFIALVSDEGSAAMTELFALYAAPLELSIVPMPLPTTLLGSPAASIYSQSDHASFWAHGYPGALATDTGIGRAGDLSRVTLADVDEAFALRVIRATVAATADLLRIQP